MEEICAMSNKFSELCFSKEAFTADNFSVDHFVSEYRKQTSLETLKEDLSLFLKVLQSAMVELINKDYADFVNLSTNLVGLDKSIKNLSTPFSQVKNEISGVQTRLDGTLKVLQKLLEERGNIHKMKNKLYRVMHVLDGIENVSKYNLQTPSYDKSVISSPGHLEAMERIAIEFSQIQFHTSQCMDVKIISDKQATMRELSTTILLHLECMFLKSMEENDVQTLYVILRIYSSIDKVKEVENKFRKHIVRPYMRETIREDAINKKGIDNMFQLVSDFIPLKCGPILDITRGGRADIEVLKGYDFLVNSVWPEVVMCLEYIAPIIFAPGNPTLFHKNYIASMAFLERFERACATQTSVRNLREHPSYKSFLEKWNLPLYFDLRFQEIGAVLETALSSSSLEQAEKSEIYNLNATSALWKSLHLCWDPKVYLKPLGHKFWKLTIQLLSRYCTWVANIIEEKNTTIPTRLTGDVSSKMTEIPPSMVTYAMLVHDIDASAMEINIFLRKQIVPKFPKFSKLQLLNEAVAQCVESYRNVSSKVGKVIVDRLVMTSTMNLKLLTEIPRLYRKTNREVPSKPSSYVLLVFNPIEKFLKDAELLVDSEKRQGWMKEVLKQVTEQCFVMTTDVITSVKKMEDSLKRLKKARDKSMSQTANTGTMSDDDKIRHQLLIDVQHFGLQVGKYGIKKEDIDFKKLEDLVLQSVSSYG